MAALAIAYVACPRVPKIDAMLENAQIESTAHAPRPAMTPSNTCNFGACVAATSARVTLGIIASRSVPAV